MSFKAIQKKWYDELRKDGFIDAEDCDTILDGDHPLKRWTGDRSLQFVKENTLLNYDDPTKSNFPEPIYNIKEDFMNYIEFKRAAEFLCRPLAKGQPGRRGKRTPQMVESIWRNHCDGLSERKIAKILDITDTHVHIIITQLTEWMNTMGTNTEDVPTYEEEPLESKVTIIIRPFDKEKDGAFLFSYWRNNLYYEEDRTADETIRFYRTINKHINNILINTKAVVKIACDKANNDCIAGCSVLIDDNLEWVYIKDAYRKQGIATLLCKGFKTISEPSTRIGLSIARRKDLKVKGE